MCRPLHRVQVYTLLRHFPQRRHVAQLADPAREQIDRCIDASEDAIAYEYTRQLQETSQVESALHARAVAQWGVAGVVELTAVIGYYTLVSMTLNAHEIPMPDGMSAALDVPIESGHAALSRLAPSSQVQA